ncbi:hypothetical protein F5Y03DRAFT_388881 [Xylaria venustula]|nr:hypothetical protein F5Y03DRAFT_388881 [Xylaria venustula]
MATGAEGYVSIVELIVYIPALIAAVIVCSRHGVHRASGWVYTVILCVVRIAGAVCQLLTYHNQSEGLLKATLIIDSIDISPLLLTILLFSTKQFRFVQLLITLGLILSIAGGSGGSSSDDGQLTVSDTSKAAIALFIIGFVGLTYFLLVSSGYRNMVPTQERRSPVAVAIDWPFILTRFVYSVLAVALHNSTFPIVGGSVGVHVALAVVEEFLVVIDYLILGFSLRKLEPEQQGVLANRTWKECRDQSVQQPAYYQR